MDSSVFVGGSVIAAVVAGTIALFAPCCISVMLPAYFASSFQNRRLLTAMTFLFAAGIATVIVPIALGAAALRQLFLQEHTTIYVAGGAIMLALAAYTLLGGKMTLPMPGRRTRRGGPFGVYTLGAFSGVASACCAPVLAGVIALSGVASSFTVALSLGLAYTFGMVVPLFVLALVWERRDWASSRLFRPRTFSYRVGPIARTITGTNLASGVLLAGIGVATVWLGVAGEAMPGASDSQANFAVRVQAIGAAVTDALAWLPLWAGAVIVAAIVAALGVRAYRQTRTASRPAAERHNSGVTPDATEESHEQHV